MPPLCFFMIPDQYPFCFINKYICEAGYSLLRLFYFYQWIILITFLLFHYHRWLIHSFSSFLLFPINLPTWISILFFPSNYHILSDLSRHNQYKQNWYRHQITNGMLFAETIPWSHSWSYFLKLLLFPLPYNEIIWNHL